MKNIIQIAVIIIVIIQSILITSLIQSIWTKVAQDIASMTQIVGMIN